MKKVAEPSHRPDSLTHPCTDTLLLETASPLKEDSLAPLYLHLLHELFWLVTCKRSDSAISEAGSEEAFCCPFVPLLENTVLGASLAWPAG